MKTLTVGTLVLVAVLPSLCFAQTEWQNHLTPIRLSDNVLVLSNATGNSVALVAATDKGLVITNSYWSEGAAEEAKQIIEQQLGRSDFKYLVLTHGSYVHALGAPVFDEALYIAHADARAYLADGSGGLGAYLGRRAEEFRDRVRRAENSPQSADPVMRSWITHCRRIADDFGTGEYELILPEMTFTDRLTLDLGNMTLELIYFGEGGNDGNLVIYIPEEGVLFLGDVFHAIHTLPYSPVRIDPARWLEVLDYLIARADSIRHIYRCNGRDAWTTETVRARRRLMADVWNKVQAADAQGLSLDETIDGLNDLESQFPYTLQWENTMPELTRSDIANTAIAIWRATHPSAADAVAARLYESGIQEARSLFEQIREEAGNRLYFAEGEFNALGYRLLGESRVSDAIEVFKMNVELYPDSDNAYDSLGEAYMNAGQNGLAIENYNKSLELNPENDNARQMLRRLGVEQ